MATKNKTTSDRLINLNEEEPLRKRPRLNDDNKSIGNEEVCIDLKRLMSYNSEITESTIITSSSLSTNNSDEDACDSGISGFQDFTSNDSPLSNKSCSNDGVEKSPKEDSKTTTKQQTTFTSTSKQDNQFVSIHHPNNSNINNMINQQTVNESSNDSQDDLEDIQLQDLNNGDSRYANEDSDSIISDISCLDSLSDFEDVGEWQSNFGPMNWVHQQINSGQNPREIIDEILPNNLISGKLDDATLWKFIFNIISEPQKRKKLNNVNNLEDVVNLIKTSKKIVILTGAGISVSSGIPDFRSRDGIYARLSVDFPDLPDPQAMFDINYFKRDQRPFYKFAKEIYPGQFKPSISHQFIKLVENHGKLLRNYTQNIDTLEKSVNIERVITCHGSFSTASCTNCKYKVDGSLIKDEIFSQKIPLCPKCTDNNELCTDSNELCVMKPDIVFFGESLPDEFHDAMAKDKEECDLLIVIGSSLKVKPVALIPTSLSPDVPQILINREHLSHMNFDVELLGDCDVIIQELCLRLGGDWSQICVNEKLKELKDFNLEEICMNPNDKSAESIASTSNNKNVDDKLKFANVIPEGSFVCVPPSTYLFKGAEIYGDNDDSSDDDEDEHTNLPLNNVDSNSESTNKVNYHSELNSSKYNASESNSDNQWFFLSGNSSNENSSHNLSKNNESYLNKSQQFNNSVPIDTNNNS